MGAGTRLRVRGRQLDVAPGTAPSRPVFQTTSNRMHAKGAPPYLYVGLAASSRELSPSGGTDSSPYSLILPTTEYRERTASQNRSLHLVLLM